MFNTKTKKRQKNVSTVFKIVLCSGLHCILGILWRNKNKIFAVIELIFLLYVPYDYIIKNDNDYCRESITMFPGDTVPLHQLWQRNCHQPGLKLYVKPSTAREICLYSILYTC